MKINAVWAKINVRWILAAVVVVLLALAAAPWTVSQSAQIDAIKREIRGSSDIRLASHGRSVFAMLPRPHIRIYDVQLDYRDGAATVEASSLRVDLGLSGLLTRRLSIARVVLANAVITIDPARARIDGPIVAAKSHWDSPPDEVEATNAKAFLKRTDGPPQAIADQCDARLDFSRASAPVSLIGHCAALPALNDDDSPTRFALWVAKPNNLRKGGESPVTLRAEGDAFHLNLNGAFTLTPKPHFHGRVAGLAPSLRQVADWFGLTLPLPGRYRDVSVQGEATIDPGALSFSPLSVTLDGNSLDGAASVRLDTLRPQISATLAGADVNLDPMFEDVPSPSANGQWSHETFAPSRLGAADLDLRLSASHARLGEFRADDAALSAILKNGRLDLSLAGASAYSGQIHARAIVAEGAEGLDVRGSASVEKIDASAFLWDVFRRQTVSGTARGAVSFETNGQSFYDFADHLDARGDFSIENGEVYGLDLDLAFRRMERQPLTAGIELRSGRTAFDQLSAKFDVIQGQAEIEEGAAREDGIALYFSGRARIADRTVDLHAVATRAPPAGSDAKPLQIGFTLSGAWDDAVLAPDALGLIQRSDAAAPLLPKPQPPQN
ncbi:AsmA family protein [Rhodoblastus acidophilus]|uniref:AsmA family protein n=1 Tax=Candidatus Rhodoblastus alkanivorans TaxID=2954117 RepID=A0ABS9Z9M6_9HYPH|nr:AsmA-like C-terminal region-containing protein [Candidatus Rhodoblastus alkanivorans]MCI4679828.1 AsmA family protein [Candidatus Rhodoblastus alkanivorans]MCI4684334.1 AsmA family protein [Candidatus Rhodoblastus alkanivorans]MDI4641655.1 AsmA family protein [Rhodoblastus acidophilus]